MALGLITAVFAYLAGSVQTDIKSALSFASLSQVGSSSPRSAWGSVTSPCSTCSGHACLRTLQFVRAPTLLHDYHTLENAIGEHLPAGGPPWDRLATRRAAAWLYRLALEQGYLDTLLTEYVRRPVRPGLPLVRRAGTALDRFPRPAGRRASRTRSSPTSEAIEEVS